MTSYTRWKLTLSTTIRSPAAKSASSAVLDGFQSYQGLRFGPSYSKSPTRSPPSVRMQARVRSVVRQLAVAVLVPPAAEIGDGAPAMVAVMFQRDEAGRMPSAFI
ncbi:MAG TPA: hypothetical protein VN364_02610 [Bellilinea sp.]|nr:hypothetical protein [Bellilinea sp.]